MAEKSAILTEERKKIAVQLAELVTAELVKLELPKAQFMPQISEHPLYEKGNVDVEFMISINRSEGFKPLAKTASGGELSRVMLALKNVFAAADQIGSVIFDEIDTGISGKAAKAVSEELLNVSQKRQVICITHLPVIAARADSYFNIVKSQNETTEISVTELSDAEKIVAIARMASGCDSEEALSFAKELCQAK